MLDWDQILRFVGAGAVFRHVPGLFGVFRVHGRQKSQADFVVRGAKEMAGLQKRHSGLDLSRFDRVAHHWRYPLDHRADAAFEANLLDRIGCNEKKLSLLASPAYLAKFLFGKGYEVHGIKHRTSMTITSKLMEPNAKIYVAGHRGLVGTALQRSLRARGYENFLTHTEPTVRG